MSRKNARKRRKNEENSPKLRNLAKGKRFSADYQPVSNGRHKKLENVIKGIPVDAQERIHEALFTALRQNNRQAAMDFLKERENDFGEYGFVLQIAINALSGKNGMQALNSILDRLFGRPKQQNELSFNGGDAEITKIEVVVKDMSKKGSENEISKKTK